MNNELIKKESKHIMRDKRTVMILFGMPIVMMTLFGFAIATDIKNVRTVVVSSSLDHATRRIIDRLAASEYFDIVETTATPTEAEHIMRNRQIWQWFSCPTTPTINKTTPQGCKSS